MLLGSAADEYLGGYSTLFSPTDDWNGFEKALGEMRRKADLQRRPGLATWWPENQPWPLNSKAFGDPVDGRDDYQKFVDWKLRDVHQYNCWHEDRTAAGNGIEARVPFLDPRLVDFARRIPTALRSELLWDKRLLRRGAQRRGLLPEQITDRPKEPFYDGRAAKYTHRMLMAMLAQDDGALIEESLQSTGGKTHLDADGVRAAFRQIQEGRGGHAELLLRVLNVAQLDAMLADLPAPLPVHPDGVTLHTLTGTAWAEMEISAAVCHDPEPVVVDQTVTLQDETFLVQRLGVGTHYVVQDGALAFELDDEQEGLMIRFLDRLRPSESVQDLVRDLGTDDETLRHCILQALESGVVRLSATPARTEEAV